MAKKFINLLAAMAVIGGAATLFAQEGAKPAKAGEGTLMIDGKNYPLTHALAYETTMNEEDLIAVVLSGQAISSEELKKAKEEERKARTLSLSGRSSNWSSVRRGHSNSGARAQTARRSAGVAEMRPGN